MAIEQMRLLRIAGASEHIESIVLTAFTTLDLHAELASHVINEGNGGVLLKEDSTFEEYLNRMESIARSLHIELQEHYDPNTPIKNEVIEANLQEVEQYFEKINEQQMQLSGLTKEDKEAIEKLRDYEVGSIAQMEYTFITFGRLTSGNLSKLEQLQDPMLSYTVLSKNAHAVWVLVITTKKYQKSVEAILDTLFFEAIAMPKYDDQKLISTCKRQLEVLYGYVNRNAKIRKLYKYIALFNDQCVITGFVPQSTVKTFKTQFKDMTDVIIQDFPSKSEEGLEPPTKLQNGWFSQPFELFIEMYGLPHYSDFDPTFYVAITYSLLFGVMFADLGQGLLLLVGGYLLYKKTKMKLAGIVMRLGIFSSFFGLIFGSFFGNEEILTPFFTNVLKLPGKPIHLMEGSTTPTILLTALGLGALLILSSIAYNIYGNCRRKDYGEALCSQNGVAGFVFYGSILMYAILEIGLHITVKNTLTMIVFIYTPLLVILLRTPLKNLIAKVGVTPHEGWGGYMMESVFELLEIVLSFVTNTMSFLRVGGFVLSHAGMMVVVMILKEMSGNGGIVVLIIGNLFVMGLEGLIVGIQTLRLEYYEMFSRYFEGGGKKYVPTAVKY